MRRAVQRILITLLLLSCYIIECRCQEPLYIVNGREVSSAEFKKIDPEIVERIEVLDADEQSIATYGPKAGDGVMLITLKFDTPARFVHPPHKSFEEYIIESADWGENEPAARVSLRFVVNKEGKIEQIETLEASDKRLLRRILKAIELSPLWQPAQKMSQAVDMRRTLRIELPMGKELAPEPYIIIL